MMLLPWLLVWIIWGVVGCTLRASWEPSSEPARPWVYAVILVGGPLFFLVPMLMALVELARWLSGQAWSRWR